MWNDDGNATATQEDVCYDTLHPISCRTSAEILPVATHIERPEGVCTFKGMTAQQFRCSIWVFTFPRLQLAEPRIEHMHVMKRAEPRLKGSHFFAWRPNQHISQTSTLATLQATTICTSMTGRYPYTVPFRLPWLLYRLASWQ